MQVLLIRCHLKDSRLHQALNCCSRPRPQSGGKKNPTDAETTHVFFSCFIVGLAHVLQRPWHGIVKVQEAVLDSQCRKVRMRVGQPLMLLRPRTGAPEDQRHGAAAHQVVDGVLAADAAVRPEAEGQEVAPVHDVLLASLAEPVRVEASRVCETLRLRRRPQSAVEHLHAAAAGVYMVGRHNVHRVAGGSLRLHIMNGRHEHACGCADLAT